MPDASQNFILKNAPCLSLDLTLDCGQSFRWEKNHDGRWCAVVSGTENGKPCSKYVEIAQNKADITFFNTSERAFVEFWSPYFDLERDYDTICNSLKSDANISKAIDEFYGIRILNQDPWETLCSFIISQNNNIPRIKGIITRLCENFGEPVITIDGNTLYSFPTAECLAKLNEDDLAPLRAGFRNKYIIDAARKVADGTVDLEKVRTLSLDEAETELIKIKGVGTKVAQCALLYGCGHIDAFPMDVWVKRIMREMYPDGLPACTSGVRGIAQQYLFHWRRNGKEWNT